MTTEERLRQAAKELRQIGLRRPTGGLYLDELLDRAAKEMDERNGILAGLALDLANAPKRET